MGAPLSNAGVAPPCCPTYTVRPKDTVASVAAAHAVAPFLLTHYNLLPSLGPLPPGQSIQIPCARIVKFAFNGTSSASPAAEPLG